MIAGILAELPQSFWQIAQQLSAALPMPLAVLSVFAEFETNLRKERQAEGISKAKANGVYKGRKPSTKPEAIA